MAEDHIPVLVEPILELFAPKDGDRLLDATLGLGGHTGEFLEAAGPSSSAVGIEADAKALAEARERLGVFGERVTYIQGNYYSLKDFISGGGILYPPLFTHILFDLGIGSHQLADETRGFSFQHDGELSMQFGVPAHLPPSHVVALNELSERLGGYPNAREIIYHLSAHELTEIIRTYGEEKYAWRIAQAIKQAVPKTSAELAQVIKDAAPASYERGRIHPATRTFQALRMAVNRELEVLEATLPVAVEALVPNGLLAVISFHSLEDRIVKRYFKKEATDCICPPEVVVCVCGHKASLKIVTKRPVEASEEERQTNPRSRSAKLRVARKK